MTKSWKQSMIGVKTKKYPKGGEEKMSGPEGASVLCQQYGTVLYVHVIPIQQLVLGAKGNFSIPDLL
jgi:hypothetical protein